MVETTMSAFTNEELEAAHKRSFRNKPCIEQSNVCGCFYCRRTCMPSEIKEYVRKDDTAICPHCGIDALLGDNSGLPVTNNEFLLAMYNRWFNCHERVYVPKD